MPVNEYPAGTSFPGVMSRAAEDSTPAWPGPLRARKRTRNVTVDTSGELITDPEPGPKLHMARP
jgi:hypothetical protein